MYYNKNIPNDVCLSCNNLNYSDDVSKTKRINDKTT